MPPPFKQVNRALRNAWRWLRAVTGDSAYDNYLRHCAANESAFSAQTKKKMTRAEFYSDSLRRKYSTINRCC